MSFSGLEISDCHLSPGDDMLPQMCEMKKYADQHPALLLIYDGDNFEIIPTGLKSWLTDAGRHTRLQFSSRCVPSQGVILLLGNHEGSLEWMKRLFTDERIRIIRNYQATDSWGRIWQFEHGHALTEWKIYGWASTWIVERLTTLPIIRDWWFEWCKRHGYMPGTYPSIGHASDFILGMYWAQCLRIAAKRRVDYLVVGHSHVLNVFPENRYPRVIDGGAALINPVGDYGGTEYG